MSEEKEPHCNSKKSKKEQHLYEIVDSQTNETVKYGISGSKLNKNGSSRRANFQVYVLNKLWDSIVYYAKILCKKIINREEALKLEQECVDNFANKNNNNAPELQKRPLPKNKKNETEQNET